MPTYQYACTACGHELEAVQSFSDESLTECPTCAGRLRKVFGSVGVVFKGSGFYRTDSRSEATAGKAKSESAESSATSTASSSSSSSSDTASSSGPKESKTDKGAKDSKGSSAAPAAGSKSSKKPVATGS